MTSLVRHVLTSVEAGPALQALAEWTPADVPGGGVHPGDIGWHLRFDNAEVLYWVDGDTPVAVGFHDDGVLRVTAAPGADRGALAADVDQLGVTWCDGLPVPGWTPHPDEAWFTMSWSPQPVSSRAEVVDATNAADRVMVQRSAFANSTFSVERWRVMKQSPAGESAVDVLVRTPGGEPAAAVTGWFAGVGRCGLLEPVGAHPDHRGHGYGRDAVLGACAALAERGASAVAVVPRAENDAGVALYRSAGFTVISENRDWVRPRGA
ncbi:GNAT family N-acetyltransferase [Actinoplanes sp. NPDC026619]|uniref:GNAT family N-acetyltransferase n=1 Tax=Actinoplanes sp. NPDC026619 TaxID=3155798 RepID=UPI0033E65596